MWGFRSIDETDSWGERGGNEKVECFNHRPALENPGPTDGDANLNRTYLDTQSRCKCVSINRKLKGFVVVRVGNVYIEEPRSKSGGRLISGDGGKIQLSNC